MRAPAFFPYISPPPLRSETTHGGNGYQGPGSFASTKPRRKRQRPPEAGLEPLDIPGPLDLRACLASTTHGQEQNNGNFSKKRPLPKTLKTVTVLKGVALKDSEGAGLLPESNQSSPHIQVEAQAHNPALASPFGSEAAASINDRRNENRRSASESITILKEGPGSVSVKLKDGNHRLDDTLLQQHHLQSHKSLTYSIRTSEGHIHGVIDIDSRQEPHHSDHVRSLIHSPLHAHQHSKGHDHNHGFPPNCALVREGVLTATARIPSSEAVKVVKHYCEEMANTAGTALTKIHATQLDLISKEHKRIKAAALAQAGRNPGTKNLRRGKKTVLPPPPLEVQAVLENNERARMSAEDSYVRHFLHLEEANRLQKDYAQYVFLARRYGPLEVDSFSITSTPGKYYVDRVGSAASTIQNWWWRVLVPMTRRRREVAKYMQPLWRGHLARKRWKPILNMRLLMGTMRLKTTVFCRWKNFMLKGRRVRVLAHRINHRWLAVIMQSWSDLVRGKRLKSAAHVAQKLQASVQSLQMKVFTAWRRWTIKNSMINNLGKQSNMRYIFKIWYIEACELRRQRIFTWAMALCIAHWRGIKQRKKYLLLRKRMKALKHLARGWRARGAFKRRKAQRWSDIVEQELLERERKELTIASAIEEQRLANLHGVLEQSRASEAADPVGWFGTSFSWKQHTSASPKKTTLSTPKGQHLSAASVQKAAHLEELLYRARHNFNIEHPPPYSCIYPHCNATFVCVRHYERHADHDHTPPLQQPEHVHGGLALWHVLLLDPQGYIAVETQVASGRGASNELSAVHLWRDSQLIRTMDTGSSEYMSALHTLYDKYLAGATYEVRGMNMQSGKNSHEYSDSPTAIEGVNLSVSELGVSLATKDALCTALYGTNFHEKKGKLVGSPKNTNTMYGTFGMKNRQKVENLSPPVHIIREIQYQVLVYLWYTVAPGFWQSPGGVHRQDVDRAAAVTLRKNVKNELLMAERAEFAREAKTLRQVALADRRKARVENLACDVVRGVEDSVIEALLNKTAGAVGSAIQAEKKVVARITNEILESLCVDEVTRDAVMRQESSALLEHLLQHTNISSQLANESINLRRIAETGEKVISSPQHESLIGALSETVVTLINTSISTELLFLALESLQISGDIDRIADTKLQNLSENSLIVIENSVVDEIWLEAIDGLSIDEFYAAESKFADKVEPADAGAIAIQGTAVGMDTQDVVVNTHVDSSEDTSMVVSKRQFEFDGTSFIRSLDAETAAIVIQCAARRRFAYKSTKSMLAQAWVKLYDPGSGMFYWHNNETGASQWEKPYLVTAYFRPVMWPAITD